MTRITNKELEFLKEGRNEFSNYPTLQTYRNCEETLIALRRYELDIEIIRISGIVATFTEQLEVIE